MKCNNCEYRSCGDDYCEECYELTMIGLCPECHIKENCAYCNKELNIKKDIPEPVCTIMFNYFCDMECYYKKYPDKRKDREKK